MSAPARSTLPYDERERRLTQAHRDYMDGKITVDELFLLRDIYGVDYAAAARAIAKANRDALRRSLPWWKRWMV